MDRAKAEHLRAVFEASLNANVDGDLADPAFLSLFDMRIAALEADPEAADNTVRSYEAARKALAATGLAKTPASELTRGVVKRAQAELQRGEDQPRRASTVNLYVSLAQAAWRWAQDMELVEVDWPHVRRLKTKRTEKRPFTDAEVAAILAWLEGYLGGKWLPLFSLLADSSARISAVLNLRGRDVNRAACEVTFRKTKTEWRSVAIPPETIALLPEAGPQELLFPGTKPGRPFRPESVRDVLHRAMKAVGIQDPEWLSTHSFRRAWVATSRREGIPAELAMKHTGHEDVKVFHGYQRNAVGDDMHAVAARVHEARRRAAGRNGGPVNGAQVAGEAREGASPSPTSGEDAHGPGAAREGVNPSPTSASAQPAASTAPVNGAQANPTPVNGAQANTAPVDGAPANTAPVGGAPAHPAPVKGRVRARRGLTSRAVRSTNEAGGSHLEGVSRLSPAIPPQVATSAPSYDFTS